MDKKQSTAERKERAAVEGRKALAEYEANGIAVRKNMERLKALRLEKEAAEREAALAAPPPEAKPKKAARSRKKDTPAEKEDASNDAE